MNKQNISNKTTFKKGQVPWNKGKKMSLACCEKMSESQKLRFQDPEQRRKMSELHRGKTPWNKGKKGPWKPSEETTKKRLESRKGYRHSKETKRKMSIAQKGKPGHPMSEETRKKLREGYKKRMCNQTHHWNYKNGKYRENGYILVKSPNHPNRKKNGYVREHRLVVEKQIGRFLKPKESCHHINNIRNDNRPENLMAFCSNSAHVSFEKWGKINPIDIIFDGRNL